MGHVLKILKDPIIYINNLSEELFNFYTYTYIDLNFTMYDTICFVMYPVTYFAMYLYVSPVLCYVFYHVFECMLSYRSYDHTKNTRLVCILLFSWGIYESIYYYTPFFFMYLCTILFSTCLYDDILHISTKTQSRWFIFV